MVGRGFINTYHYRTSGSRSNLSGDTGLSQIKAR
jgi:hypothetical protein